MKAFLFLLLSVMCAQAQLKSLMESNSIVVRPTNFWAVATNDVTFSNAVQAVQLRSDPNALTNFDSREIMFTGSKLTLSNSAQAAWMKLQVGLEDGTNELSFSGGQVLVTPRLYNDGGISTSSNVVAQQFVATTELGYAGNGGILTNLNGTNLQAGTVLSSAMESNAWYLATNQVAADSLWTTDGNSITNGQVVAISGPNHDPSVRVFRNGGFQSWLGEMDIPALEVKAGDIVLTNDTVHVKTGEVFTEFNSTGIAINGIVLWADSIIETTNVFGVSGEYGVTTNLTVSIPGGSLVLEIRGGIITAITSTPP